MDRRLWCDPHFSILHVDPGVESKWDLLVLDNANLVTMQVQQEQ